MIQRAEISAWFGRYNEAEALYQDMGRKDLAIDLRQRSNDWFHVAQLLKQSGGHDDDDDAQMTAASWVIITNHSKAFYDDPCCINIYLPLPGRPSDFLSYSSTPPVPC